MALKALIVLALVQLCCAGGRFPELQHAQVELPEAFQGIMGNQSSSGGGAGGMVGLELAQNLFERQSCPVGQNNCGFVGECCPVNSGNTCCGTLCIASRPEGTTCCPGYLCAAGWKCCGQSAGCSPDGGDCCNTAGQFCPADWSCCGDKGHCNPTKDFKCCGNDGTYCPKSDTCVICKGSTTRTCCQGPDDAQIPVFQALGPTGDESLNIPNPTTIRGASQSAASSSAPHSTTTAAAASSAAAGASSSGTASSSRSAASTTAAAGGGGSPSSGSLKEFYWNFAVALGLASVVALLL